VSIFGKLKCEIGVHTFEYSGTLNYYPYEETTGSPMKSEPLHKRCIYCNNVYKNYSFGQWKFVGRKETRND
jgi:hypothetical protein